MVGICTFSPKFSCSLVCFFHRRKIRHVHFFPQLPMHFFFAKKKNSIFQPNQEQRGHFFFKLDFVTFATKEKVNRINEGFGK